MVEIYRNVFSSIHDTKLPVLASGVVIIMEARMGKF